MEGFKPQQKVRCIDDDGVETMLTEGKTYTVIAVDAPYLYLGTYDDCSLPPNVGGMYMYRFEPV